MCKSHNQSQCSNMNSGGQNQEPLEKQNSWLVDSYLILYLRSSVSQLSERAKIVKASLPRLEIQIRNFTPSFTLCRESERHEGIFFARREENSRNGVPFLCVAWICARFKLPSSCHRPIQLHCPHCIIYSLLLTTKTEPLFVSRYCAACY